MNNPQNTNNINHAAEAAKLHVDVSSFDRPHGGDEDDVPQGDTGPKPKVSTEQINAAQDHVPTYVDDPLNAQGVISREYTQMHTNGPNAGTGGQGVDIPEPLITRPQFTAPPPINPTGTGAQGQHAGAGPQPAFEPPKPPPPPKYNAAASDMSQGQKRKAAKETAEIMLTGYQQLVPKPFVMIGEYK